MLEQVHRHILSDLQQTAWTDTLSVVTAVLFNLAALMTIRLSLAERPVGEGVIIAARR